MSDPERRGDREKTTVEAVQAELDRQRAELEKQQPLAALALMLFDLRTALDRLAGADASEIAADPDRVRSKCASLAASVGDIIAITDRVIADEKQKTLLVAAPAVGGKQ